MNPLLDKLKELRGNLFKKGVIGETLNELNQCIALAQAQGEQRGEWISVKDRLPEMTDVSRTVKQSPYVLVYTDKPTAEEYKTKLAFLCEICGASPQWKSAGLGGTVTHWMPLPTPPSTTGS